MRHPLQRAWLAAALLCAACRSPAILTLETRAEELDLAQARITPAPLEDRSSSGRRVLRFPAGTRVRVELPMACPLEVALSTGAAQAELRPLFALDAEQAQLGFDADFTLTARPGCAEASGGAIRWSQLDGKPIAIASEDEGRRLRAHTAALPAVRPHGLVPLSFDGAGQFTLLARWQGANGARWEARWRGGAAARYGGMPSLAVGHATVLGGRGWKIAEASPNARARLDTLGEDAASFRPQSSGRWLLRDDEGRELPLRAGWYDHTPLDCGRPDCHPRIAADALTSKMSYVLARGLDGALGADYAPRCAIACHSVGEPGTPDGGFMDVLARLEGALPRHPALGTWAGLMRGLRRLGGVGCAACHGPGAIPDASGRWAILRADVCAVCHDAPPRYGHVAAWRTSAMARADADPEARRDPACARCHTTAGFLASLGQEVAKRWAAPEDAAPIGIGCAACHAAHAAHGDRALVRTVPVPVALGEVEVPPTSRICLPCHSPSPGEARSASQAAIWLGRGGLGVDGAALPSRAPHANVPGGCLGCHAAGPAVERGATHGFAVDWARCAGCHPGRDNRAAVATIREEIDRRARGLLARLGERVEARKGHVSLSLVGSVETPRGRAVHDLGLVLHDRGAAAHNAGYARALLEAAATIR